MSIVYKYKEDDRVFSYNTKLGLVVLMRNSCMYDKNSLVSYMSFFSERAERLHGYHIRTDNPDNFVDDLIKYGLVEIDYAN